MINEIMDSILRMPCDFKYQATKKRRKNQKKRSGYWNSTNHKWFTSFYKYEPITETMIHYRVPRPENVVHKTNVALYDGDLYAFGGGSGSKPLATIQTYDFRSNRWILLDETLPEPSEEVISFGIPNQDKILVLDQNNGTNLWFNPQTRSITNCELTFPHYEKRTMQLAYMRNQLIVLNSDENNIVNICTDIERDTWITVAPGFVFQTRPFTTTDNCIYFEPDCDDFIVRFNIETLKWSGVPLLLPEQREVFGESRLNWIVTEDDVLIVSCNSELISKRDGNSFIED